MPDMDTDLSPGIISAIEPQVQQPDRYSIFIDGSFALGVGGDVVVRFSLYKGKLLSAADLAVLQSEEEYGRAMSRAFRLISHRERSEHEIRSRLRGHQYSPEIIDRVTERLHALEMLDDMKFAVSFACARVRAKGYGPERITRELRRLGLADDILHGALETAYADADLEALALKAGRKAWKRLQYETNASKRRRKLTNSLRLRGFSYDLIRAALKQIESQEPD